jgi:protoporphyrinogen oxidase
MEASTAELARAAQETIRHVFPDFEGEFLANRIFKWRDKLPTFRPGYLDAVAAFWEDPQEDPVFFCGDYFAGPSTGAALNTGREVTERLLASL